MISWELFVGVALLLGGVTAFLPNVFLAQIAAIFAIIGGALLLFGASATWRR